MSPVALLAGLASKGVTVTVEGEALLARPASRLDERTRELLRTHKPAVTRYLTERDTIPRLPWELERLVSAASSNLLSFNMRGIPDVNRYVLAWAAAYLISDQDEALKRLWEVYATWPNAPGRKAPEPRTAE